MEVNALTLRHLSFTGPTKQKATLEFSNGLNVIYGASETGKSFVLESIDFMLGAQGPLRDIPERVGYDRIMLGIESSSGETFTVVRSMSGGNFQVYEGLVKEISIGSVGKVLGAKHSADSPDNLSSYLLGKIGFDKRLIKKSKTDTRSLSFRDLSHLCLINETNIQKIGSPIETGQNIFKTAEFSVFKLMLTGIDESAFVELQKADLDLSEKRVKLELLNDLIKDMKEGLGEKKGDLVDLQNQIIQLERSLEEIQDYLTSNEDNYQRLRTARNEFTKQIADSNDRKNEIEGLVNRFTLLDNHYQSDLNRLESIREAGSIMGALELTTCPLCGAAPDHQHPDQSADGNVDVIVSATRVESDKILQLRNELQPTIQRLNLEKANLEKIIIPDLEKSLARVEGNIGELKPIVLDGRSQYAAIVDKKGAVQSVILMWEQINQFVERKSKLSVDDAFEEKEEPVSDSTDLSSTVLNEFSKQVEAILRAWNFPETERVYFDEKTRDLVISGKKRSSRGKGMRSITHAAFIIGILEFCRTKGTPHPGFVILDSPLLAYREPEDPADDLRNTDVLNQFYHYLSQWQDRQCIVIENINPPDTVRQRPTSAFFSKVPGEDRYGLFPI